MRSRKRSRPAVLIHRYAEQLVACLGDGHVAASPLGLWLLLAMLAPTAQASARERLEEILGTDAEAAATQAAALLSDPHPALGVAVAVWTRLAFVGTRFDAWAVRLPSGIEIGDLPEQPDADAWTADRTRGLIDRFPIELDEQTAVVLASVLATDVSWDEPFEVVPAKRLSGQFGRLCRHALEAGDGHTQLLADTDAAGLVAVHAAGGAGGLEVVSVIADRSVSSARVLAACGQVAALLGGDDRHAREVSLFDIPLGTGHAWEITETQVQAGSPPEAFFTVMPAWSARSELDLVGMPGVDEALATLRTLLRSDVPPLEAVARQSVLATFTRKGFSAAAVSAMGQGALAAQPTRALMTQRMATVWFNRPYAAVAVSRGEPAGATWDGVPVFCAWIASVDEAELA